SLVRDRRRGRGDPAGALRALSSGRAAGTGRARGRAGRLPGLPASACARAVFPHLPHRERLPRHRRRPGRGRARRGATGRGRPEGRRGRGRRRDARMGVTALLGGAFDPPHNGHVALARAAQEQFEPERLVVLVAERPGHKEAVLDAETRLRLARAAFPELEVELDPYERTVDRLEERRYPDPLFLVGADQFAHFLEWKEPDRVLELAQLGVATRPG